MVFSDVFLVQKSHNLKGKTLDVKKALSKTEMDRVNSSRGRDGGRDMGRGGRGNDNYNGGGNWGNGRGNNGGGNWNNGGGFGGRCRISNLIVVFIN